MVFTKTNADIFLNRQSNELQISICFSYFSKIKAICAFFLSFVKQKYWNDNDEDGDDDDDDLVCKASFNNKLYQDYGRVIMKHHTIMS